MRALPWLFFIAAFYIAQVEDDYYTAHHHGGSLIVRLGLGFVAFMLMGIGAEVWRRVRP